MVAGAIAGNISAEATTPAGNTFAEAMRGLRSLTVGAIEAARVVLPVCRAPRIATTGNRFNRPAILARKAF